MPLYAAPDGGADSALLSSPDCAELTQAMAYMGINPPGSALYLSAGGAFFVPIRLAQRRTYVRAWWLNGTAVAGNADLGVYTISGTTGTRLQSIGATAQAGVSTMQTVTINWTFDPGLYYLAFSHSEATTGQYWRAQPNSITNRISGIYQAAAQSPLAASPTVVSSTSAYCPFFGLAEQSVI